MRICIPTRDDRGLDAGTYGHVGGAPYYTVVDTQSDRVETIARGAHGHGSGGRCEPGVRIAGLGVQAVVCTDIGRRAIESVEAAGITVMVSQAKTAGDVLTEARRGDLRMLTSAEVCAGHGARHGQCGGGDGRRSHRAKRAEDEGK